MHYRYTLDRPRLRCIASAPPMAPAAAVAPATGAVPATDGEGAAGAPAEQQAAAGSGSGASAGRPEAVCKETKLLLLEEGVAIEGGARGPGPGPLGGMLGWWWLALRSTPRVGARLSRAAGPFLALHLRLPWGTVAFVEFHPPFANAASCPTRPAVLHPVAGTP